MRWREVKEMAATVEQLTSPYDPDARCSTKRDMEGIGYKVHFTETCDADTPHLLVNVETTPATTPDDHMAAVVHQSLKGRNLLPREHLREGVTSVVSYSTKGIRPTAPRFGNGVDYEMAVSHFEFHFVSQVTLPQERFGYADTTGITDANDVGFHSKS
ncbi:MAG TPA: hypothetical protein VKK81_28595 [Candidatus Binatia bacterium]|nr:hypothetical protein [Candidatus Binatia bacterium]